MSLRTTLSIARSTTLVIASLIPLALPAGPTFTSPAKVVVPASDSTGSGGSAGSGGSTGGSQDAGPVTRYTMVTPTGGDVNVRTGPSTTRRILGTLHAGERTLYTGRTGDWYRVYGSDGQVWNTGYVHTRYTRTVIVYCNNYTCWT